MIHKYLILKSYGYVAVLFPCFHQPPTHFFSFKPIINRGWIIQDKKGHFSMGHNNGWVIMNDSSLQYSLTDHSRIYSCQNF